MEAFKSFLSIVILLGALQGFITSILLFKNRSNVANKLLAWIILLISLACLDVYLFQAFDYKVKSTSYHLIRAILPLGIYMPIFPLIYFYTKTLLDSGFRINKSNRFHFYTIIIDVAPYFIALVYVVGILLKSISPESNNTYGEVIYVLNTYSDVPRWVSLVFYLWLVYKEINIKSRSEVNKPQIYWAKQLFKGFAIFSIVWFLYLIPYVIPSASKKLVATLGWFPLYIPLTILIYWLGIKGYFIGTKIKEPITPKTKLEPQLIEKTLLGLSNAMQNDKLYLNGELKLIDVVEHTKIPQKTISAVLNQHLNKSFNEYVNAYRIQEVKSKLVDPDFTHLTITGIALECGFNSQATFQRTFKLLTKQSPKEFRSNIENRGLNSSQI